MPLPTQQRAARLSLLRHARKARLALALLALLSCYARELCAQAPASSFSVVDVGSDTLVFERVRPDGSASEGLVVDSSALVRTLKAQVLEARGLGEVAELDEAGERGSALSRSERAGGSSSQATPYAFSHRFAPPFESLDATLRLRPLAEPDAGKFVYPLSALLGAFIVLGLYALYRMAATHVTFAERRNNFVAAVSHELKTPLTAIRMHSEMLQEGMVADEAKRQDYFRTITAESERLTRLINNVLELSRLERRRAPVQLKLGQVRPVIEQALGALRPHAEAEGFTIELDAPGELASVSFDADALKQVLFNLIDNALKYSRDATDKRITVSCAPSERGGVRLAVRDRGPGVHKESLKAVFQPFFRGERELTRRNPGTGIGLSLVKGLVEAMGGTVRGENAEPGFRVWFDLLAR